MMTRSRCRHAVLLTTGLAVCLSAPALAAPTKPKKPIPSQDAKRGRDVFEVQRCGSCHAVSAEAIGKRPPPGLKLPPDLSGVGARRSAAWLRAWLRQEPTPDVGKERPNRRHPVRFRGSERDLRDLVAWLVTLKSPASTKPPAGTRARTRSR